MISYYIISILLIFNLFLSLLSWIIDGSEKRGFPHLDELTSFRSCQNPLKLLFSLLLPVIGAPSTGLRPWRLDELFQTLTELHIEPYPRLLHLSYKYLRHF